MTDQEKLDAAAYNQSYHFDDLVPNEYNGKDNLEIGKIQDDHIYALVHDGQLNKLDQGEIAPEYFFDQSTFDKYVDPKTGEFDSQALSEALQVQPFPDNATGDGAEYRTSIACFNVNGDIEAPMGYCEANTQFGGGGAHEVYIPHNESSQYYAYVEAESVDEAREKAKEEFYDANFGDLEDIGNCDTEQINVSDKDGNVVWER